MTDTDLGGVCECEIGGDHEPCQFYNSKTVKARKVHRCYECGMDINPGQKYERVGGRSSDGFFEFKTHLACAGIRNDFCCGMHGSVAETFEATYGFSPWRAVTDDR